MVKVLENERLLIEVEARGSQLVRVFDKKNQREVLWNADPAFWPKHSPLLFPMIGASYNKKYRVDGVEYDMPNHGFAWTSEFAFVEQEWEDSPVDRSGKSASGKFELDDSRAEKITAVLKSSEESKEKYPYDFELTVMHELSGNRIRVSWLVKNTGESDMLYSIGAHPAFMMPDGRKTSDMYLAFPGKKETCEQGMSEGKTLPFYRIDSGSGCALCEDVKTLALDEDACVKITEDFWNEDVYIFDHQDLSEVSLCHGDKTPYVTIYSEGFPFFGVWAKPGAPFVCLEPWQGRCDRHGYTGELKDKDGIRVLAAGESEEFCYEIEVV